MGNTMENIANIFSSLAFPSAVAAYLLIKTTSKLEELTHHILRIAQTLDRIDQRKVGNTSG